MSEITLNCTDEMLPMGKIYVKKTGLSDEFAQVEDLCFPYQHNAMDPPSPFDQQVEEDNVFCADFCETS